MNKQPNTDVVKFQNVDILTFTKNDNHLIAIKPLCEIFGIDWEGQRQKLNRDELFRSTTFVTKVVAADGKTRKMMCLPLRVFPMWLARINTSRVQDPEAARLILAFQREATQVLYEHFMGYYTTTPGAVRNMVRRELAKDRLAEYLYCSDMWNEQTINRMVELKSHPQIDLTNTELGRVFNCSPTTIKKAYRLMRRAQGDFEDKRPDGLKPDDYRRIQLEDGRVSLPADTANAENIWYMPTPSGH